MIWVVEWMDATGNWSVLGWRDTRAEARGMAQDNRARGFKCRIAKYVRAS